MILQNVIQQRTNLFRQVNILQNCVSCHPLPLNEVSTYLPYETIV